MQTVNFDNLGPEQLTALVGKPATVIVYNRSDDSFSSSLSGVIGNLMISGEQVHVETRGVSAPAWIEFSGPDKYGTVTFEATVQPV